MLSHEMLKTSKLASGIATLIAGEESQDAWEALLITHRSHCQQTQDVKGRRLLVDEAAVCFPGTVFISLDKHAVLFAHISVGCL